MTAALVQDIDAALEDVVPPLAGLQPAATNAVALQPMLPVSVSGDRQYVLSLRYGAVLDGPALRALLDGTLHKAYQ
jgi:hypothetical protein